MPFSLGCHQADTGQADLRREAHLEGQATAPRQECTT